MKVPWVPLEVGTYQYEEDSYLPGFKYPHAKKGDTYYRANEAWSKWAQYSSGFIGDLGLLDVPRKATEEQKTDIECTKWFIKYHWNDLEEEFVKKCINKAKSKRIRMFEFLATEYFRAKGYEITWSGSVPFKDPHKP